MEVAFGLLKSTKRHVVANIVPGASAVYVPVVGAALRSVAAHVVQNP